MASWNSLLPLPPWPTLLTAVFDQSPTTPHLQWFKGDTESNLLEVVETGFRVRWDMVRRRVCMFSRCC